MIKGNRVALELDQETIESMLREQVGASIAAALAGSGEALVQQLVKETLDLKVDRDGKPTSSRYSNETFVGYLVKRMIREAAQEAMKEWLSENKERMRKAVRRHMETHPDNIADAIVDSLHQNLSSGMEWQFKVDICTRDH